MKYKNSTDLFRIGNAIWAFLGLGRPKKYRVLYLIWIAVFNIFVVLLYPLHLILGLFQLKYRSEIFQNLTMNCSDVLCSLKYIFIWWNLSKIRRIERIFAVLDKRIQTEEEDNYFKKVIGNCKLIFFINGALFMNGCISLELSTLIAHERRLLYPGWLPFDWKMSNTNYWIAHIYQFIGICLQAVASFANDMYAPVCLSILSGQLRLLAIRLIKLGTDPKKSKSENNWELRLCIQDHAKLIKIYHLLSDVLSKGMFFQIIATGFNLCCVIIYLVFYSDNLFAVAHYSILFGIMLFEIFPCCYFGSVFETEFNSLPYAVLSSNWMDQDKEFKQNIIIFSQRGFQETSFRCMGFLKLHLETFYITIKSAYSLFAVILQAK